MNSCIIVHVPISAEIMMANTAKSRGFFFIYYCGELHHLFTVTCFLFNLPRLLGSQIILAWPVDSGLIMWFVLAKEMLMDMPFAACGKGLKSSVIWGWWCCSETITMKTDCSKEWLATLSALVLGKIHGAQAIPAESKPSCSHITWIRNKYALVYAPVVLGLFCYTNRWTIQLLQSLIYLQK